MGDGDAKEPFIAAGNNRAVQVWRNDNRRLFDDALKEEFLEHFSTTANVAASAAAIGVAENTVYTHRRKDARFRADFWAALEQSLAKLTALRLQREIERAEGRLEAGVGAAMDGPPDARQIADLVKLIQALGTLTRNLSGEPHESGREPQAAPVDAVCAVLSKRLEALGIRTAAGEEEEASGEPGAGDLCEDEGGGGEGAGRGGER